MQLDLAKIFSDPRLMLFGFDGDFAQFLPMTRETHAQSIFADGRVQAAPGNAIRVHLGPLLEHLEKSGFRPPRINFIHHFAQSGSTLLARALDCPSNLVIREPLHLRQLGVAASAAANGNLTADQRTVLAFSLAMLGKRFARDSTLIVKGNVPISLLAEDIVELDPGQPAILLYFPLEDYCAAVLRTPGHRQWLENVVSEIQLGADAHIGDTFGLGPAEKAAALWFSMMMRFTRMLANNTEMRSLDANQLFNHPLETVIAASELLDAGLDVREARKVVDGPLFATYSKNPAVPFDATTRAERHEQAKASLAPELELARRWTEQRAAKLGLPVRLDRPMIGESSGLL